MKCTQFLNFLKFIDFRERTGERGWTIQWVLLYSQYRAAISTVPEHFDYPQNKLRPVNSHSLASPLALPWQPLVYFLSVWICISQTCQINVVIQYKGTFCDWLLSLHIMFSRFVVVVARVSTSVLFLAECVVRLVMPHFVYPFIE